jgi:ABC-type transport system substrate-binding protein
VAATSANKDVVVAIQSQLKAVGIDVDLDFVEQMKITEMQSKGWKNALLFTLFQAEGNMIPAIGFNFPPGRTHRYTVVKDPPNWKQVYDAAGTPAKWEAKLNQGFTQAIFDDAMFIPIYWEPIMYVVKDNVRDIGLGTLGPIGSGLGWETADTWLSK